MPMIDVGGYGLSVTRRGSGPAVMFVAGVGEPGRNWETVLDSLRVFAPSITTITYDRAGIGDSDACPDPGVGRSYRFFADQVRQIIAGLGVREPVVLVGHSFGCVITRVFAAQWPALVRGLVPVEGSVAGMRLWPGDWDGRDGDAPHATLVDAEQGAQEVVPLQPIAPAVVITRTPGRWNSPHATSEIDTYWRDRHVALAVERGAVHLLALDGGHRLNVEAPNLIATAIAEVLRAAQSGGPVQLAPSTLARAGGTRAAPFGVG